ncbi:MAG: AIR synthase-related protein [Acidobacteriota bacterium]
MFGYSVTGVIHPDEVAANAGAKPGDVLILTKPIGTGVISTGIKFGKATKEMAESSVKAHADRWSQRRRSHARIRCARSNRHHWFGLMGHAWEVAKGSGVTIELNAKHILLIDGALDMARRKMLTQGDKTNREYIGNDFCWIPTSPKKWPACCSIRKPPEAC